MTDMQALRSVEVQLNPNFGERYKLAIAAGLLEAVRLSTGRLGISLGVIAVDPESAAKCKARGIAHVLKRTPVRDLVTGDHIVIAGFLQVHTEDKDGYASLRVDAGTKYVVLSNRDNTLTAQVVMSDGLEVANGRVVTQAITDKESTTLKVVPVP